MTVLHLISSGGLYGAEAVILNLSRRLHQNSEHRSVLAVFANGTSNEPLEKAAENAGVELHAIPCRGQVDLGVPNRLRALLQLTGAEVVHAHGYKADVYAALTFKGAHRPRLVSTCHTWYDNDVAVRLYGALDRFALRRFDAVVAVSEEVRQRLLRSGVHGERIHIIRNGVDLGPFLSAAQQRALHPKAGRPLHVGLIGRLAPEKGVDVFLRAVKELLQARPSLALQAYFNIVGDGPQRGELEALRNELGLESLVDLQGRCDDMPVCYASLDILVSASRQEGLPVALLEGMASGLPLIATAVGEVPPLARGNTTALLVPPLDPRALADAMARLLDDGELRALLGAAGQRLIATEYSADAMTTEYLRVYTGASASLVADHGTTLSAGRA